MVLRTTNGGVSWTELSPDLSTKDPQPDHSVGRHRGRQPRPVLWRGGLLHRALRRPARASSGRAPTTARSGTRSDAGKNWNDVTKNINGLPAWGVVSKIEPSHFDAGTAYICVDFHLMDNRDPWVYKTDGLRQDVDQDQRQSAQGSAGLCARDRGESESRRACCSSARATRSTTR